MNFAAVFPVEKLACRCLLSRQLLERERVAGRNGPVEDRGATADATWIFRALRENDASIARTSSANENVRARQTKSVIDYMCSVGMPASSLFEDVVRQDQRGMQIPTRSTARSFGQDLEQQRVEKATTEATQKKASECRRRPVQGRGERGPANIEIPTRSTTRSLA